MGVWLKKQAQHVLKLFLIVVPILLGLGCIEQGKDAVTGSAVRTTTLDCDVNNPCVELKTDPYGEQYCKKYDGVQREGCQGFAGECKEYRCVNGNCVIVNVSGQTPGCNGSAGKCKIHTCVDGSCEIVDEPNCCGNGKCEEGENCNNCEEDCERIYPEPCPCSCDDGNPFTADFCNETTLFECYHVDEPCKDDDGICLQDCNSKNDNDCEGEIIATIQSCPCGDFIIKQNKLVFSYSNNLYVYDSKLEKIVRIPLPKGYDYYDHDFDGDEIYVVVRDEDDEYYLMKFDLRGRLKDKRKLPGRSLVYADQDHVYTLIEDPVNTLRIYRKDFLIPLKELVFSTRKNKLLSDDNHIYVYSQEGDSLHLFKVSKVSWEMENFTRTKLGEVEILNAGRFLLFVEKQNFLLFKLNFVWYEKDSMSPVKRFSIETEMPNQFSTYAEKVIFAEVGGKVIADHFYERRIYLSKIDFDGNVTDSISFALGGGYPEFLGLDDEHLFFKTTENVIVLDNPWKETIS